MNRFAVSGLQPALALLYRACVRRPSSLYLRFFLPFAGATALAVLLAWWVATTLLTRALEDRLDTQLEQATGVLADGVFPLTAELLARAADLVQADLALVDASGSVGATSAIGPDGAVHALGAATLRPDPTRPTFSQARVEGHPYRLLVRPLAAGRDDRYAAIVAIASLGDVHAAAARAAFWLGIAALAGALGTAWIGHRVARNITGPMRALTDMARRIAAGDRQARAPGGTGGEIGELTDTLNAMAAELESYENDVAEKSRLETLGEVAARVAHEVRNPLTSIKMQLELLAEDSEPASGPGGEPAAASERRRRVDAIIDELRRLELIVAGVLERGRPSTLNRRPADLARVARDVASLMRPQLAHRGLDLQIHADAEAPLELDTDKVKQVVFNLVNNAADALTDSGRIRICVARTTRDQVALTVEDSGPGLEPATRDAFNAGETVGSGGMGLDLCRELVEQHGGTLAAGVSNELGGARLSAVFPVPTAEVD